MSRLKLYSFCLLEWCSLSVKLRSPEWKDRGAAVQALEKDLRKVGTLGLRDELLKLLTRENKVTDDLFREGVGTNGRYGEDFSEYYAHLLGVVFRSANLADAQTLTHHCLCIHCSIIGR